MNAGALGSNCQRAVEAAAWLGIAWVAFHIVARALQPLGNSDVFWQVRAGELMLQAHQVPATDPFSYTIAGEPWNNHEWTWELVAAMLQRAFGWGAFRLLVLALWGGSAAALAGFVARRLGPAYALVVLEVFLETAGYKFKPVPQLVSMPLTLACIAFFRGKAMLESRGRAGALALTMLVWGQVTAEALTFIPLLVADQLCLRLADRPRDEPKRDRIALLLTVLAGVVCLVPTPWSWSIDYALRGTAINRVVNNEFTPLWAPALAVRPAAKWLGIVIVGAYVPWTARRLWGARQDQRWEVRRASSLGLLLVARAVLQERDLWLLVLPLTQMLLALRGRRWLSLAALASALALHWAHARELRFDDRIVLRALMNPRFRDEHIASTLVPTACIDRLTRLSPGTRVYTLRMWASYLIWRQPELRVFIDGRNLEYGLELFHRSTDVWEGQLGARAILDASHTDVVVAKPGWDARPGLVGGPWTPVIVEANCAVFTRGPAAWPASQPNAESSP